MLLSFRRSWFFRFVAVRSALAVVFVPFFQVRQALAFDPSSFRGSSSAMASAVESLIEFKAKASGALTVAESAALPEALGTAVTSWGAAEAAAEGLALSTPVGWLGLGAAAVLAGAAVGAKYCIDSGCSLSWLSSSNPGKVLIPSVSAPPISSSTGYWFIGRDNFTTICSTSAACAALYTQYLVANPNYISHGLKITSASPPVLSDHLESYDAYTFDYKYNDGYDETGNEMFEVHHSDISQNCVGAVIDTLSECSKTVSSLVLPSQYLPSKEASYQDANASVDTKYGSAQLSDQSFSSIADSVWQRAASQSGYAGPVYHPISADDVAAWQKVGNAMPSVADAASSVGNFAGSASQPLLTGAVAFPAPDGASGLLPSHGSSSGRSSSSCGSKSNPCEVDWGSKSDLSASDPDVSQTGFLKPFFNFLPVQSHAFVIPSGSCEIPDFPSTYLTPSVSMQSKCDLLAKLGPSITPFADVFWALSAMFILLSA